MFLLKIITNIRLIYEDFTILYLYSELPFARTYESNQKELLRCCLINLKYKC